MRRLSLTILLTIALYSAKAQSYASLYDRETRPLLSTEWSIGLGPAYTGIDPKASDSDVTLSPRLWIGGYMGMSLLIGRSFALHGEIDYMFGNIMASSGKVQHKVKSRSIEVPVMMSYRAWDCVRLNVGVSITAMDRSRYVNAKDDTMEFGAVRPTWNFVVGAGLTLGRRLLLEARYVRALQRTLNYFEGREFDSDSYRVSLTVGILF
ncbi:MAG: hypothetical protein K2F95_06265 [Alistipes sp.]|nr:hypothetical protein [Alistipes sp.]MDE7128734.1 hypothetical protein [Alistipes sp.]